MLAALRIRRDTVRSAQMPCGWPPLRQGLAQQLMGTLHHGISRAAGNKPGKADNRLRQQRSSEHGEREPSPTATRQTRKGLLDRLYRIGEGTQDRQQVTGNPSCLSFYMLSIRCWSSLRVLLPLSPRHAALGRTDLTSSGTWSSNCLKLAVNFSASARA